MMKEDKEKEESMPEEVVKEEIVGDEKSENPEQDEERKEKHTKAKHHKEDKTVKLEEEIAQLNDKYLRLYSEFDNYRKRTIKEKVELSKTASADVILSILPVLDDFERAIKAFEISDESTDALKHGIILIFNKFTNILSQQGLKQIKAVGEEFNTDFHEAITLIPATDPGMKGKVIDETEKGYMLYDKVIRYSKVVVAS
jgi:molecular chaperone GrpE